MPNSAANGGSGGADSTDADHSPVVSGFNRTDRHVVDVSRWTELAHKTLVGEDVTIGQLDVIFVDPDEMAELNMTHMGHEGPTDVLSFPLDIDDDFPVMPAAAGVGDGNDDAEELLDPVQIHLGDIVICPAVAERQAPDHCGTVDAELSLLVVHGVLHILGHDHAEPDETLIMQDRERHHLSALGLTHPVTA